MSSCGGGVLIARDCGPRIAKNLVNPALAGYVWRPIHEIFVDSEIHCAIHEHQPKSSCLPTTQIPIEQAIQIPNRQRRIWNVPEIAPRFQSRPSTIVQLPHCFVQPSTQTNLRLRTSKPVNDDETKLRWNEEAINKQMHSKNEMQNKIGLTRTLYYYSFEH